MSNILSKGSDGRLYLGLASFLYYTRKFGYEVKPHGNYRLLFDKGGYVYFEIYDYPEENRVACGCVYTSVNDLYTVFSEKPELIKILENECKRIPWGRQDENPHCNPKVSIVDTVIGRKRFHCYKS